MFPTIVKNAKNNEPILLTKESGTQFIWAGDQAKIYAAVIASNLNRRIFTGVGVEFITWEQIARYAVQHVGSKSQIVLEEKPGAGPGDRFDVSAIEKEFGLKFTSFEKMKEHVAYLAGRYS
jgi:UDP-glucose 4-epimerase